MARSRPLSCPGFADTLDMFGFDADHPDTLANLAAELAQHKTRHPVFDAMMIHIEQCDHCTGISDPEVSRRVLAPRPGKVA